LDRRLVREQLGHDPLRELPVDLPLDGRTVLVEAACTTNAGSPCGAIAAKTITRQGRRGGVRRR